MQTMHSHFTKEPALGSEAVIWNSEVRYVLGTYWLVLGTYYALVSYHLVPLRLSTCFYPKYVLSTYFLPQVRTEYVLLK